MRGQTAVRTAARGMLVALFAAAPLCLGHMENWEPVGVLLVASVAGLLWVAGGGRLWSARPSLAEGLLLAAFLGSFLLLPRSVYLYGSLLALSLPVGGFLAFLLARAALAEERWNLAGWQALMAGAFVAALMGAREYTTNAILLEDPSWRAFGPFYNPNLLGGYLALLLWVAPALALGAQTRRRPAPPATLPPKASARARAGGRREASPPPVAETPRYAEIAWSIATVIMAVTLLCTGSKGAFLGVLVGVPVFGGLGAAAGSPLGKGLRWGMAGVLALAILGAATFPPLRARLQNAFGSQEGSGSFRAYTWQGTVDMITARPLTGFGPGDFAQAYPRYARAGFTREAHDTPLQLAAEHGVPVTLLLLGGMALLVGQVKRRAGRAEGRSRLLTAAAVAGAVGFWLHNLVDYTWYVSACAVAYWGVMGLALPQESPEPGTGAARAHAARAVAVVVLVALAFWASAAVTSEAFVAAGLRYGRLGALDLARERLQHALPFDAERWVTLSRIEERVGGGQREACERAVAARQRAAELQPTEVTNYVSLARLHVALGDLPQAEADLNRAIQVYPTSTEALAALGRLQEGRGERAAALATYRSLAALWDTPVRTAQAVDYMVDDNYLPAFLALARDAQRRGDPQTAAERAAQTVKLAQEVIARQKELQQVLEAGGRFDPERSAEAERLMEQAKRLKVLPGGGGK